MDINQLQLIGYVVYSGFGCFILWAVTQGAIAFAEHKTGRSLDYRSITITVFELLSVGMIIAACIRAFFQ